MTDFHPDSPLFSSALSTHIEHFSRMRVKKICGSITSSSSLEPFINAALTSTEGGKHLRGLGVFLGADIASKAKNKELPPMYTHTASSVPQADTTLTSAPSPDLTLMAAAMEIYQASALVHDDVIDHASTRRGRTTPHVFLSQMHKRSNWNESSEDFGCAGAILIGDLLLSCANLTATHSVAHISEPIKSDILTRFARMHTEVALGQMLDIQAEVHPLDSNNPSSVTLNNALEIIAHKTVNYSVVTPVTIGALMRGADPDLLALLTKILTPWGIAFQLRDDDLGVFGDPTYTGKPASSDLHEGKRTALLALTWAHSSQEERRTLLAGLSTDDTDKVSLARAIIESNGKPEHEKLINMMKQRGFDALQAARLHPHQVERLEAFAKILTNRTN